MKIRMIITFAVIPLFCYSQTQNISLSEAYRSNSKKELQLFYDKWNEKYKSIDYSDSAELKSIAYKIYVKFYDPGRLYKIGLEQSAPNRLDWVKYYIIQNRLDIFKIEADTLNPNIEDIPEDTLLIAKDSIIDFRPKINFEEVKQLYLTDEYKTILLDFLGDSHKPLGQGGIMNPARSKGNSEKKQKFLNNFVVIIYGHWGGYWHLETHPQVFNIIINKFDTEAIVNYRLGYQGGNAIYKKIGNDWVFVDGGLTWIE